MQFRSLVAATVAALALASLSAQADPVKIRMGWVAAPASLVPILFPVPGIAKHNGVTYTVEAIHFQGSPLQITALQAGEIDTAALGFSSFSLAVENAGMTDLKIIADEIHWGVEGYGTADFAVLKVGPF
jgi:sulfonate transport system substrate-binding protein